MHPLEVLKKLRKLKTTKTRQNLLRKLPEDNPFWLIAWHVLDIYKVCFPFLSGLEDPYYYGEGAPVEIFTKILDIGESQIFNASKMHKAVIAFSKKCTEEEWTEFYKPILEGNLFIPLAPADLIEVSPHSHKYPTAPGKFDFKRIESLERVVFPRAIEPYPDAERAFWYFGPGIAAAFLPNGRRVDHPLLEKAKEVYDKTRVRIFIDLYMESEEILTIRDILHTDTFFHGLGNRNQSLKERQEALEQFINALWEVGITGADLIERYYLYADDSMQTIRGNTQMFYEQGYPGVVMVEKSGLVIEDIPVITHPTKKNVVTCLDIISGADAYENKTEYLIYRGMIGGKKVTGRVHYGLTWEQRDTYFKDRDNLIGKRFEILSCGTNADGRVIMPVFQKWRN